MENTTIPADAFAAVVAQLAVLSFVPPADCEKPEKLVGPTKVAVEVPDGQKNTVNVAGGDYYFLGRYGKFPGNYKYTKGDPFKVTQTERQYSAITITLHKVVDGNYHYEPVSGEAFESLEI